MKKRIPLYLLLAVCFDLNAQTVNVAPNATEHLSGEVCYYEEITYNLWNLRLFDAPDQRGQQIVQAIKRPQSIECHEFDANGNETVITRYVQRDANVGSIGFDDDGNIGFTANEISRAVPDTRTVKSYDSSGRLITTRTWSFNLGDSALVLSDSCVYDSTGVFCGIIMLRDSISLPNRYESLDRNGSYSITYPDGTAESYRYDSEHQLTRYRDRDRTTVRYSYDERGSVIHQTSEWENGGTLNVIFTDYEYDEYGNWTRCTRQVKDPGNPPRSTKILERTFIYR